MKLTPQQREAALDEGERARLASILTPLPEVASAYESAEARARDLRTALNMERHRADQVYRIFRDRLADELGSKALVVVRDEDEGSIAYRANADRRGIDRFKVGAVAPFAPGAPGGTP